jgi:hypothetical protein
MLEALSQAVTLQVKKRVALPVDTVTDADV